MGQGKPADGMPPFQDLQGQAGDSADLMRLFVHGSLLAMTSALKGWARAAEILARRGEVIAEGLRGLQRDDSSADSRAALVDEVRSALREIVEVPGQEARQLQVDLQRLLEGTLAAAPEARPRGHRRRAKAKP